MKLSIRLLALAAGFSMATAPAFAANYTCTGGTPNACTAYIVNYGLGSCGTANAICAQSVHDAIADAATHYSGGLNGNDTWDIRFPSGLTTITGAPVGSDKGFFDVSGIWPGGAGGSGTGVLSFIGAADLTSGVITGNAYTTVYGTGVSHIHFYRFTFERDTPTVTQGTVVSSAKGSVTIKLPSSSFIDPVTLNNNAIADGGSGGGYIRAYTNALAPQMVNTDSTNTQIAWNSVAASGSNYKISFTNSSNTISTTAYASNAFVCIKNPGPNQAYYFNDSSSFNTSGVAGTDISFNWVTWQDQARGVFRYINNASVTNSTIQVRPAPGGSGTQGYCMASPDGGPQFSQPGDACGTSSPINCPTHQYTVTGINANNNTIDRTGDDSIAVFGAFNDTTSNIKNNSINSAFARTVALFATCYINVPITGGSANTLTNSFDFSPNNVPDVLISGTYYYAGEVTDISTTVSQPQKYFNTSPCVGSDGNYDNNPPL